MTRKASSGDENVPPSTTNTSRKSSAYPIVNPDSLPWHLPSPGATRHPLPQCGRGRDPRRQPREGEGRRGLGLADKPPEPPRHLVRLDGRAAELFERARRDPHVVESRSLAGERVAEGGVE